MQQSSMTMSPFESSPSREQEEREHEEIEQKLIEALQSPSVPVGKDFWNELRRTAHARYAAASDKQ
jgi:hypothetical protein